MQNFIQLEFTSLNFFLLNEFYKQSINKHQSSLKPHRVFVPCATTVSNQL